MHPVKSLIAQIKKGHPDAAERLGLMESEVSGGLGSWRGEAAAALVEALSHKNPKMRFEAAWALGGFREHAAGAIPSLVQLLKDPDNEVRAQAAESLSCIGLAPQFIPQAIDALSDENPVVRECVAWALAHLKAQAAAAVPALIAALADPVGHVRQRAAVTLGEIGAAAGDAVPVLFRLILAGDEGDPIDLVLALQSICAQNDAAAGTVRELLAARDQPVPQALAIPLARAATEVPGAERHGPSGRDT